MGETVGKVGPEGAGEPIVALHKKYSGGASDIEQTCVRMNSYPHDNLAYTPERRLMRIVFYSSLRAPMTNHLPGDVETPQPNRRESK